MTFDSSLFPAFSSTEAELLLLSTKRTHTKYFRNKKNITTCTKHKTKAVDTDSIKSFLNNLSIPQLCEELKLSCKGQITIEECKSILETFQNNRDEISMEAYENCGDLICQLFINWIYESFVKEEMPNSQK